MDPGAEYDSRITPREQTQNMEPVNEDQEEEMGQDESQQIMGQEGDDADQPVEQE